MGARPMWTCPRCGRRFANRNQSHSCGRFSVRDHLRGKLREVVAMYRRFAAMIRLTGPVRTHPVKTRIAFISRMSFAGAVLKRDRLDVAFILARRAESPRFRKVDSYGGDHAHYLTIRSIEELDDELQAWLDEAASVGRQEHLRSPRVQPRGR